MQWDKSSQEPSLIQEVRKSLVDDMIFKLRSKGKGAGAKGKSSGKENK